MHTLICRSNNCNKKAKYICGECKIAVYCSKICHNTTWEERHREEHGIEFINAPVAFEQNIENWEKFWQEHKIGSLKVLGRATYEMLFSIENNEGKKYALKVYINEENYDATKTAIYADISRKCDSAMKYYGSGEIFFTAEMKLYSKIKMYGEINPEKIENMNKVIVSKMEFIKGKNLKKFEGGDVVKTFVQIAILLLEQLVCFHNNGLLHNDIKPENIIIIGEWPKISRVVLIDYGVGPTEGYVAPEVSEGGSLSKKSDVWSLAITFVTMTIQNQERYKFRLYFPNSSAGENATFINQVWEWNKYKTTNDANEKIKKNIAGIVLEMIHRDPNKRLDAAGVLRKFKTLERKFFKL